MFSINPTTLDTILFYKCEHVNIFFLKLAEKIMCHFTKAAFFFTIDATPNNQTVNNEPSDSESAMEESSGTEDVNLERKERKYGDKKVVYPGEVRR